HAPFGGVVPEIAARAHAEKLDAVVADAMTRAGLSYGELDGVAATSGPGLIGGVMVGAMTGKAIALAWDLPFIAVNHLEGHALSPRLAEPVAFPFLLLLVSGGHTQLLMVEEIGRYRRLGSTIDDAAGEAFDKTAKVLGLGHPGGPALERLARGGDADRFPLPRPLLREDGLDFSFAGLKTAARRAWESLDAPAQTDRADLAASFQKAVADILADRARRALAHVDGRATAFVVAGGVAANTVVRAALADAATAAQTRLIAPALRWCTDNAAMIALVGAERLRRGLRDPLDAPARPRWPLDEAAARARPSAGAGRKGPKA
ncbi:MAG: tRNA (adenosine(37)-N6)-threonylcarbamoyltransferase complex transferase subunit TsaD, partial [Caulobacterales bacterium]|nr:tRNA (adenosine(37)-N6)-threonylcarbamoyltransferase complex transferase subunit TsaD [Caulobacterales bacterium]